MRYSLFIVIAVTVTCFLLLPLASAAIMCVIIGFVLYFSLRRHAIFNKSRHQKVFRSDGFQHLLKNGFSMVAVNDYLGIAGFYKEFYFDIYFDWAAHVRRMNESAIVFQVYFKTDPEDIETIISTLNKKLIPPIHSGDTYRIEWSSGHLTLEKKCGVNYLSNTEYYPLMDRCVQLLKENNFQPMGMDELFTLRENCPGRYIPEIPLYSEK